MKNPEIIDAANGVSQLPEAIIQHIQSLLSLNEAAQTSTLSKSWHNAWSTRPDLDFDQRRSVRYYRNYWNVRRFLESAKKTIQRYEDSNLNIKSFNLFLDRTESDIRVLGDELTMKALKLGAIELSLSVSLGCPVFPVTINAYEFRNLKVLRLDIEPLFSDYEFPCLKVLTLNRCFSKKDAGKQDAGIRICSPSLEFLAFEHGNILEAKLDVPKIRKFTLSGYHNTLPRLSFERSASSECVAELWFECAEKQFKTSWLIVFEKFLEQLSPFKVMLSLEIGWNVEVVFGIFGGLNLYWRI